MKQIPQIITSSRIKRMQQDSSTRPIAQHG